MSTYTKTEWQPGQLITTSLINNIENTLAEITPGATNIALPYSEFFQYEKGMYCLHNGNLWKCLQHVDTGSIEPGSSNSEQYWKSTLIVNEINNCNKNIVEEYDENNNYQIGDYVIHYTDLYKCLFNNITGEWDSEKWELITLTDELININKNLDVNNQKIDSTELASIDSYPKYLGYLNDSNQWKNINNNYQHIIIPIQQNDVIEIFNKGSQAIFGKFLSDYSIPVLNETVNYVIADSAFTITSSNPRKIILAPESSKYLLIQIIYNSNTINFNLYINNCCYTTSARRDINQKISAVQDQINFSYITPFSELKIYDGMITSVTNDNITTYKWDNKTNVHFKLVPCPPNVTLKLQANGSIDKALYWGILKEFTNQANDPVFSEDNNFNTRKYLNPGTSEQTYTTPSDTKYIYIQTYYNSTDTTPVILKINNYNLLTNFYTNYTTIDNTIQNTATLIENVADINEDISDINGDISDINEQLPILTDRLEILENQQSYYIRNDLNNLTPYNGYLTNSDKWDNINTNYQHVIVPAMPGMKLEITGKSGQELRFGVLRDYTTPVKNEDIPYSQDMNWNTRISKSSNNNSFVGMLPYDTKYIVIVVNRNGIDWTPSYFNLTYQKQQSIKWCAMGDSITQGIVSSIDNDVPITSQSADTINAWAPTVARLNNWNLNNIGIGGTGFLDPANINLELIPNPTEADYKRAWWVAQNTDFSQYDLVTVAYGINDYKGNQPLGSLNTEYDGSTPTSIYTAIQSIIWSVLGNGTTIETNNNPNVKLIFITPLNIYKQSTATYGSYATNYAINQPNNAKDADDPTQNAPYTLEDLCNAIIECCEYYGIEYIDMTHASVINRQNIKTMLPDGVHPSIKAHELLARELAKKINFV